MHLPNEFLDPATSGAMMGAAVGAVATALAKVRALFAMRRTEAVTTEGMKLGGFSRGFSLVGKEPLLQLVTVAGFIFAMQMLNFPIEQGTSGHFVGGVFAVVVLGPWLGLLAMTGVLFMQAFLLGDGGVLALGANSINMGVVASVGGFYLVKFLRGQRGNFELSVAVAAFVSIVTAALCVAAELAWSGMAPFTIVGWAMLRAHLLIAASEAIITVLLLRVLAIKHLYGASE